MNANMFRIARPVLVAAALATILWVSAGDLNPPAGPIEPTQRTPIGANTTPGDADSLFKITSPGSYYLTGNITGVSGKIGIEIAASGVTLDLMGFDLLGVPGSLDGVSVSGAATDIAVLNGSVRNWAGDGVDLNAPNTRLADLRASGNTFSGIRASNNAVVTGCAAYLNGSSGIIILNNGSITDCSANQNGSNGIASVLGSTIINCSTRNNAGDGIGGGSGCTITNCTVENNGDDGINAGDGNTISNCTAYGNTGDGISVLNDCTVRGNTCYANGTGIHATQDDNRIEGNNCTNNARGIDVDVAGNFISRNICSGNTTNWDVVAGNVCLVLSATTNGAAILGNSGGVSPGSTDPNANFTY